MLAMLLDARPRGPGKPHQGQIRLLARSVPRRVRVSRCTASRNYRRYDRTASSGSVVANDPVDGRDPSGQELYIQGSLAYRQEVLRELRILSSGLAGRAEVNGLIKSPLQIMIRSGSDALTPSNQRNVGNNTAPTNDAGSMNGKGSGSTIAYDPKQTGGMSVDGSRERPAFVGLGHELGHAEENMTGSRPSGAEPTPVPGVTPSVESHAVGRENQIRAEHGIPARTTYEPPANCKVGPGQCK